MAKAVKLADIAEALQVSAVTVSKALTGKKGVSEELRERIKQVSEEMGYRHPSQVQEVPQQTSYNIGVVVSERYLGKYESFYWDIYQKLASQAVKRESFTVLELLSLEDEKQAKMPRLIRDNKVQGVVVIGSLEKVFVRMLSDECKLPVIYLDYYDNVPGMDSVISDGYYGMYALTNYLFDMGHREIGFLGTLLATSSITDRYFGYAKSMMEHGVEIRPEWLVGDRDVETGAVRIDLPEKLPTAFACNSDFMANFLIRQLNEEGYQVPDDISVVGFDNYIIPGLTQLGITTYEVNINEMAKAAVKSILRKIENKYYRPGIKIIEGNIVYKESVKRLSR